MHFEQILYLGDIYLDLVGILGADDISTGRKIHIMDMKSQSINTWKI